MAEGLDQTLLPRLGGARLDRLCSSARFWQLDRMESYYRCRQYDRLAHDWDGNLIGYGDELGLMPGYYVPHRHRRPRARYDLAKIVVERFTWLLFGKEHWPEIEVEGDPEAEDYAKALVAASNLPTRILEARNLGGAQGTAVMSFGFIAGKPRVAAHNAKHIHPLEWEDRAEHRLAAVLEAYSYPQTVWDAEGRPKEETYYYAHYWDQDVEVIWDPIPEEIARRGDWAERVPSHSVQHGFGFCPVYWCQNLPDSSSLDGASDFEAQEVNLDDINILLSATAKGGVANVDPTLVIKDDPDNNEGMVKKGSGHAIYSKGGADYLELTGSAIEAGLKLFDQERQNILEACSCVLPDPEKVAGRAQSAAALRLVYGPMLAVCDVFRTQYGQGLLVPILRDMLKVARSIHGRAAKPERVRTADGRVLEVRPSVSLPPRIEKVMVEEPTGELNPVTGEPLTRKVAKVTRVARSPGVSEDLTLVWGTYFPATAQDNKLTVEAAQSAAGNKQLIARATAVRNVASIFGIADVEAELAAIEEDEDLAAALAERMGPQPPRPGDEEDSQRGGGVSPPPEPGDEGGGED